ncbi:MAG: M20/M25/M40 family metallo-hydrolase [Thermodesulfobacteriota bacterium]
MISKDRMTNHLMDTIRIDSPSKKEKPVALKLQKEMEELGAECFYDDAGDKVGGDVGNLLVQLKGNSSEAPPFFLSSHMDTVNPGIGIKPKIEDGIMKSDGTTILGADDKSGLSIIVEVLRTLKEQDIPHGDIEVAFTICEEIGLLGAKYFDTARLKSDYGIVLDSSTPDRLVLKCPSSDYLTVRVHGLEAHAGLCPENGINAIKIASEAISNMTIGRIDNETTANIAIIQGGVATNIVPNLITVTGEARSHDNDKLDKQVQHMCDCFQQAAANYSVVLEGEKKTPTIDIDINRVYEKMDVSSSAKVTNMVNMAVSNLGHSIEHHTTGGGCDANYFNNNGIECVNLGTGMYELHTVNEYLILDEFYRSADIVLETLKLNAST